MPKINRYYSSDRQDYAVGIWAQRSEFEGNIYLSQQIFLSSFPYSTEGRPNEDYRPFYVILIGPYNDIATFFERVNRNAPQLLEAGELTIFSPNHLVESLSFVQDLAAVKLPTTMTRPQQPSLSDGKVVVSATSPPYELLEISPESAADSTINYSLPLTLAPHSLAPSGFTATVEAEAYDEFEKNFRSSPAILSFSP
ncbi:MAG: hypothetical protein HC890_19790 [Chloroflexaceae bacterium]|nr:hypothetical protein [Chloroflexaceae bacterium]